MFSRLALAAAILIMAINIHGCQSATQIPASPQMAAAMTHRKADEAVAQAQRAAALADKEFAAIDKLTAQAGPAPGVVRGHPSLSRADALRQQSLAHRSAALQYHEIALTLHTLAATATDEADRNRLFSEAAYFRSLGLKFQELSDACATEAAKVGVK